jgi:hypothetical protein
MKRKLIKPVPFLTLGQEYEVSSTVVNPVNGNILIYVQGHWYRDSFFSPADPTFPYVLRDLLAQANQVARHAGKRARWGAKGAIQFCDSPQGRFYISRYFKEEARLISRYGTKEPSNVNPSCL